MDKRARRMVLAIVLVTMFVLIPSRSNASNEPDQVFEPTTVTGSQAVTITAVVTANSTSRNVTTITQFFTTSQETWSLVSTVTRTAVTNVTLLQVVSTTVPYQAVVAAVFTSWSGDAYLLMVTLGLTGILGLMLGYLLPSRRSRRQPQLPMVPKEPDAPFGLTSDPGSREENQDSAAIDYALESSSEYICRVVVADGVSGEAGGRIASSLAVKTVLTATSDADDFREALQQSIATANRAILDYSASKFRGQRLATTVVAAILTEDAVSVGHVGDSRAYLFHGGQLIRLTRDHTVTQQLLDERRITEAQALSHPDRHKLTKALGHRPTVEPDLVTYYVAKGDIMLLCTDGLTEGLSDAEITDSVTGRTDMAGVSKTLVAAAKRAGVQDNITVAIVRVI